MPAPDYERKNYHTIDGDNAGRKQRLAYRVLEACRSGEPIDQHNHRRKKQNGHGAGQQSGIQARHPPRISQTLRLTNICLISPMALAGFRPFGQALAQFMIVWQR